MGEMFEKRMMDVCGELTMVLTQGSTVTTPSAFMGAAMSTICKMVIHSDDEHGIAQFLAQWRNEAGEPVSAVHQSEWPLACQREVFLDGERPPTVFSIKRVKQGLTEIHYNSFSSNDDLVCALTQHFSVDALVEIYQSVSESCYWALWDNGEKLRSVETGNGGSTQTEGEKLSFEDEHIGQNVGDAEDPLYVFGYEDMDEYAQESGFAIEVYEQYESGWLNVQKESGHAQTQMIDGRSKNRWWKFW